MAYVALYRKYRSQSFGELMGQEQVTRTLQNALQSGRIAHAYLFHGARGCGKTSTARLLARALNCVAQDGPTPEPCGVCRLCVSIRDGACMDVVEMDAASETGIDDVREKIIENVQYAPGEARYKVYIIDEVHDLSAKAFDALLKTLEEPPAHVVFILATTELHKVPVTIKSRCQPYPFKRGSLHDLAAAIQRVIDGESYTADAEAVLSIARSAEGSWRDALSLLEQVIAYSEGHISADTVHQAIGTVGSETLTKVTEVLARGDWNDTLSIAGELVESGKDVRQLLTALSAHLRELMLISAGAKSAAAQELGAERITRLTPQAELFGPPTLLAMMREISKAERELRFTNQHRITLEMTLLRLMPENLEQREQDTGAKNRGVQSAGHSEAQRPSDVPDAGREAAPPAPSTHTPEAPPAASRYDAPLSSTPASVPRPPMFNTRQAQEDALSADADGDADDDVDVEAFVAEPTLLPPTVQPAARVSELLKPPETNGTTYPTESAGTSRFADEVNFDVVLRAWPRILASFKKTSANGAIWLEKGKVTGLEGRAVILTFEDSFAHGRIHNNAKGRAKIEQTINDILKSEGYTIRCEMNYGPGTKAPESAGGNGRVEPVAQVQTLLDAPVEEAAAATRIADFDVQRDVPTPAPDPARQAPDTDEDEPAGAEAPAPPTPTSTGTGLLEETLDIFGGEVIKSERIK